MYKIVDRGVGFAIEVAAEDGNRRHVHLSAYLDDSVQNEPWLRHLQEGLGYWELMLTACHQMCTQDLRVGVRSGSGKFAEQAGGTVLPVEFSIIFAMVGHASSTKQHLDCRCMSVWQCSSPSRWCRYKYTIRGALMTVEIVGKGQAAKQPDRFDCPC